MNKVKCIVWDLDNTLWKGVLAEGDDVKLDMEVVAVIKALDQRGILNSIASKNNYNLAMEKLKEFKMNEYFLYPKISWNSKSQSIQKISKDLNLNLNNFAFVDDQLYELKEVKFNNPEILCLKDTEITEILKKPEFTPDFITKDSSLRRKMYQDDIKRKDEEVLFSKSQEKFLKQLNMRFSINEATEEDLERVSELCTRTHQLNTTGYTYSYEELINFMISPDYKLLITELEDKYGSYGKTGIALVKCEKDDWYLKLLLMSCRVISRNVGGVLLNYIIKCAKESKVNLIAEFKPTNCNRMMYITYKFNGFKEIEKNEDTVYLKCDLATKVNFPKYIEIIVNN